MLSTVRGFPVDDDAFGDDGEDAPETGGLSGEETAGCGGTGNEISSGDAAMEASITFRQSNGSGLIDSSRLINPQNVMTGLSLTR
ncbi:hypothetical protein JFB37_21370 [Dickeya solani]|nr:hypothetical protein [Dickeya solani]